MINRHIMAAINEALEKYPAVALLGPRQCGKTTTAQEMGGHYFDLEQPDELARLDWQWDDITRGEKLVILDEAQTYPELFPRLRGAIDKRRRQRGRFMLLGSVSPLLMKRVEQSLAGRLAVVELSPLMLGEVGASRIKNLWLRGGYPDGGILKGGDFPKWQKYYLRVLANRDLPNWGLPATPQTTAKLFASLAAGHGGIWNASKIGARLGLSYHTINSYLDYLENAFLIRRLPPFFANTDKRLRKSPKVYWRDSGLLHALLGTSTHGDLTAHPRAGASWESFVIEQIISALTAAGESFDAFYLRHNDRLEADLVLRVAKKLWAIEIKLTTSPLAADFRKLDTAADLIGADRRALITQSKKIIEGKNKVACDLPAFLAML